jgi:sucrose phosphorylase
MPNELEKKLRDHVAFIYGEEPAEQITTRIFERLARFRGAYPELASSSPENRVSERDSTLITYGDMVQQDGQPPLQTLAAFLQKYLGDVVSTIHILPFFPYSSDDGFSVIDYRAVNPELGDWDDVARLGAGFRLMFDAVVNHISSQSVEFQGFLKGDPDFQEFFTVVEPGTDLSRVFRPRATPVTTPYETANGEKLVWTTFSADQVDLNYRSPDVLIEVIDILLFYASQGADFIRLDAVTYVWKEIGTDCINMPRTHRIVQLMRTVLDIAAPRVAIITETNVPHKDNIAYFGDGTNEAQMVYNFALPMLTLHAFQKGDVSTLAEWAETLELPSEQATFFNFLAGHDGIGMLPVKNILSIEDRNEAITRTLELGGFVSYKSNEDGSQSPYELNINYLDALSEPAPPPEKLDQLDELNINYLDALDDPQTPKDDIELITKRFLATQAIMLALRGVPGIYFHSLFGSRNWTDGVKETGRYRTINREKLPLEKLEGELSDTASLRHHIFQGYCKLLKARKNNPAFHPFGEQEILSVHLSVFGVLRTSLDQKTKTVCLHNVTRQKLRVSINLEGLALDKSTTLTDILSQKEFLAESQNLQIELAPFEVLWLSQ